MTKVIAGHKDLQRLEVSVKQVPKINENGDQVSTTFNIVWRADENGSVERELRLDLLVSEDRVPLGPLNDGIRVPFRRDRDGVIRAEFSVAHKDLGNASLWFWGADGVYYLSLKDFVLNFPKRESPFDNGGFPPSEK